VFYLDRDMPVSMRAEVFFRSLTFFIFSISEEIRRNKKYYAICSISVISPENHVHCRYRCCYWWIYINLLQWDAS